MACSSCNFSGSVRTVYLVRFHDSSTTFLSRFSAVALSPQPYLNTLYLPSRDSVTKSIFVAKYKNNIYFHLSFTSITSILLYRPLSHTQISPKTTSLTLFIPFEYKILIHRPIASPIENITISPMGIFHIKYLPNG